MSLKGVKYVVLILSGKGGVGKSSLTLQLALTLSLQHHSVGILDIDLTGPSIPHLLSLPDARPIQTAAGWSPIPVHSQTSDHGALSAMSLGFLLPSRDSAVIWRGPKKTAMINQLFESTAWGELDYLLIDTPPGTSDEHISAVTALMETCDLGRGQLAGAVLVTTPQAVATADVRKELNFCEKVGLRVLGVVENMAGFLCPCCGEVSKLFGEGGGEVLAQEKSVPFLGRLPVDLEWGKLVERIHTSTSEDSLVDGRDSKQLVYRYRQGRSYPLVEMITRDLRRGIEERPP
ncbi:MAG: cytosolic Fe-S cluster assembly factor cfd1 [Vezdaea aestivalis]|nr:MAG: cytosolic Fe-S cluster assembly factor cfd1 [Vezdaea aestivalis]